MPHRGEELRGDRRGPPPPQDEQQYAHRSSPKPPTDTTRLRSRSPPGRRPAAPTDSYRSRSPHHGSGRRHHRQRPRDEDEPRSRGRDDTHRLTVSSHNRSPHRKNHHHHRSSKSTAKIDLPFDARPLTKRDFEAFQPLFGYYLDIQKGLQISELDNNEVRGRWKSFLGKWNRGELAEGWYDPERFQHCVSTRPVEEMSREVREESNNGMDLDRASRPREPTPPTRNAAEMTGTGEHREGVGGDSDDDYGPALPPGQSRSQPGSKRGPAIPGFQDLQAKREMEEEARMDRIDEIRAARKADRVEQKERLDDLAPRAEAGTRERQLEKKRALNDKLKSFRDKSPGGGVAEVPEQDLLGGGDGLDDFKRMIASQQRKKTDREIRREEIARAKAEEREEKLREYRAREEGKMEKLIELARQRFG